MKAGAKGATVRRDLVTLSCLCSCAVSWDFIDINPVKQFGKRHIRESPPRTTYPTAEQVDRRRCSLRDRQVLLSLHGRNPLYVKTPSMREILICLHGLSLVLNGPQYLVESPGS
jgi:hypothetical protein